MASSGRLKCTVQKIHERPRRLEVVCHQGHRPLHLYLTVVQFFHRIRTFHLEKFRSRGVRTETDGSPRQERGSMKTSGKAFFKFSVQDDFLPLRVVASDFFPELAQRAWLWIINATANKAIFRLQVQVVKRSGTLFSGRIKYDTKIRLIWWRTFGKAHVTILASQAFGPIQPSFLDPGVNLPETLD